MPGLSKETVVDIWLNSDDAVRVLEKGYKIIHAAVEYFYLVCTSHHPKRQMTDGRIADTVIGSEPMAEVQVGVTPLKVGRGYTREPCPRSTLT